SAALAITLLATGCSDKPSPTDSQQKKAGQRVPVPVVVAQAEAKDVPIELRNIGNVEAFATVTMRSQITGQVIKIHFQEGQDVKKGDLLFSIDPRPSQGALRRAQADLARDQAQLRSAELEFGRQKKLLESSIG